MGTEKPPRGYSIPPFILQLLAWPIGRFLLHFFLHLEVRGTENLKNLAKEIPSSKGVVLAINHSSELDPIIALAGIPPFSRFFPMFYLSAPDKSFKDAHFGWRRFIYGKWFFRAWGSYPARFGSRDYAYSLETHIALLQDGATVTIFPTGKIERHGEERPEARGGVAYLAEAADVSIIPIAITGLLGKLTMKTFLCRKLHVTLTYGTPINIEKITNANLPEEERYRAAAAQVMSTIDALGSSNSAAFK